jgi:mannose-6-phosphate isomerase
VKRAILSRLDHPLLLTPHAAERVWGGRRIADLFGRDLPQGPIGESWEVHGDLAVAHGPFEGRSLDSMVCEFGAELLGRRGNPQESFPLLTKWLDCKDWLSVQVHPDDALARELTGQPAQRGKSEAWYVVCRDEDATLIHGLREGASAEQLSGLSDRSILDLLNHATPQPGDLLFTGAGTVHALGPGFLIYEIQQSSDLTYRLFDWGRDRPVHPVESSRCAREAVAPGCTRDDRGLRCAYFEVEVVEGAQAFRYAGESFGILAAVEGSWRLRGSFGEVALELGDTILLPAHLGDVRLKPIGGGRLLRISLGDGEP